MAEARSGLTPLQRPRRSAVADSNKNIVTGSKPEILFCRVQRCCSRRQGLRSSAAGHRGERFICGAAGSPGTRHGIQESEARGWKQPLTRPRDITQNHHGICLVVLDPGPEPAALGLAASPCSIAPRRLAALRRDRSDSSDVWDCRPCRRSPPRTARTVACAILWRAEEPVEMDSQMLTGRRSPIPMVLSRHPRQPPARSVTVRRKVSPLILAET